MPISLILALVLMAVITFEVASGYFNVLPIAGRRSQLAKFSSSRFIAALASVLGVLSNGTGRLSYFISN